MIVLTINCKPQPPDKHISFQLLTDCNHQGEGSAAPPFLPRNNLTSNMLQLSSTWKHFLHPGHKGTSVLLQAFFLEVQIPESFTWGRSSCFRMKMMLSSHLRFKPCALERPSPGIRLILNSPNEHPFCRQ